MGISPPALSTDKGAIFQLLLTVCGNMALARQAITHGFQHVLHRKKLENPRVRQGHAYSSLQTPLSIADDARCNIICEETATISGVRFVVNESGTIVLANTFYSNMAA